LGLSYAARYPAYYKVAGYSIFRDLNQVQINRQTYDFLNFMGDVGGLDGVLVIVFAYFASGL
jgi:hypothetical protein